MTRDFIRAGKWQTLPSIQSSLLVRKLSLAPSKSIKMGKRRGFFHHLSVTAEVTFSYEKGFLFRPSPASEAFYVWVVRVVCPLRFLILLLHPNCYLGYCQCLEIME